MKKVRIIGKDCRTTDYGILKSGKEYSIEDPLAAFLTRRGIAEFVVIKKKAAKKAASKK